MRATIRSREGAHPWLPISGHFWDYQKRRQRAEGASPAGALRCPGSIILPRPSGDDWTRSERYNQTIAVSGEHETDPGTLWMDGSGLESVGMGGAYAFYDPGERPSPHVIVNKRGLWRDGERRLAWWEGEASSG